MRSRVARSAARLTPLEQPQVARHDRNRKRHTRGAGGDARMSPRRVGVRSSVPSIPVTFALGDAKHPACPMPSRLPASPVFAIGMPIEAGGAEDRAHVFYDDLYVAVATGNGAPAHGAGCLVLDRQGGSRHRLGASIALPGARRQGSAPAGRVSLCKMVRCSGNRTEYRRDGQRENYGALHDDSLSPLGDLNPRPALYESAALPLS